MADNSYPHDEPRPAAPAPETPIDAGSQALTEALRSSFAIVKVVMVALVFVFLGSGFFQVGPQERAIVLRLGRPVAEGEGALLGPGLHWSLPYPIDECVRVSITGIQEIKSTVGWYATTPAAEAAGSEPPPGASLNPAVDGYALTADGNIIHTRATLRYHIKDPIRYVFSFVNASNTVQNALDNALLQTTAHSNVDDILTRERLAFSEAVRKRATELVEQRNLGIQVEQCFVQSIPPRQLNDAFANVLKAEVTRNKVLNEARGFENQVVSKAIAESNSRTNLAQSDRVRLVNDVKAQAERFKELLPQYQRNPALFIQQRLTETLGRVLTNAQDKILLTEPADGKPRELRLLLNREPPKLKVEEPKP